MKADDVGAIQSIVVVEADETTTTTQQQQQQQQHKQQQQQIIDVDETFHYYPTVHVKVVPLSLVSSVRDEITNNATTTATTTAAAMTFYEYLLQSECQPSKACNTCLYRRRQRIGFPKPCIEICGTCLSESLCASSSTRTTSGNTIISSTRNNNNNNNNERNMTTTTPLSPQRHLPVTSEWHVMRTTSSSNQQDHDVSHLLPASHHSVVIPRIVHQTWKEPLTPQRYPHHYQYQQSFRRQGNKSSSSSSSSLWDYRFYTDEDALTFLKKHFPQPLVQAYQDVLPGAFKADLFRYCVLLIHGGVYADIDVEIQIALDELETYYLWKKKKKPSPLLLVPVDPVPGMEIHNTPCLWNGLMVSTPGHPIIAKVIELAVNGIRNRYTSFDSDHARLCGGTTSETHGNETSSSSSLKALYLSHKLAPLYVTGPCLLGVAANTVLGRHPQEGFDSLATMTTTTTTTNFSSLILNDENIGSERNNNASLLQLLSIRKRSARDKLLEILLPTVEEDVNHVLARTGMTEEIDSSPSSSAKRNAPGGNAHDDGTDHQIDNNNHYTKTRVGFGGTYGLPGGGVYVDDEKAYEEIRIIVH